MPKLYDVFDGSVARSIMTPAGPLEIAQDTNPEEGETLARIDGKLRWRAGVDGGEAGPATQLSVPTEGGPEVLTVGYVAPGALLRRDPSTQYVTGVQLDDLLRNARVWTGNPYIDPPLTPSSDDDEFDGDSPDLAERGWTIHRLSNRAVLTRVGDVLWWHANTGSGLGATQYRSTIVGSKLMLQLPTTALGDILIFKEIADADPSGLYAARVTSRSPMGDASGVNPVGSRYMFGADTALPFAASTRFQNLGMDHYAANGTQRIIGYISNGSSTTVIGYDEPGTMRVLPFDVLAMNYDAVAGALHRGIFDAASGQSLRPSAASAAGNISSGHPIRYWGFQLFGNTDNAGYCIYELDYFRRLPVGSFFGA